MSFAALDHMHMARALRLAERGLYTTQPNPRVGCVIAHGDEIVGEGWHQRAGEAHAEVIALRTAGGRARAATAYVTLEPCSHFGRTPPCADALIAAGVARVVAAVEDSNPQVAGGGFARLRAAGILVETGLMRDAARELNRGFFARVERGRPWIRIKLAMSLDGRTALANGESKWITGEAARADVQRWRARSSAILTGIGTVLADDPRLTVRLEPVEPDKGDRVVRGSEAGTTRFADGLSGDVSRQPPATGEASSCVPPWRVVLDRTLRTPAGAKVFAADAPTLFVNGDGTRSVDSRFSGVELAAVTADAQGRLDLDAVLRLLATRGMNEVQVEAGPTLCGALLQGGFVDELLVYVAPVVLGNSARPLLALAQLEAMASARRLRIFDRRSIGADERILYRE